MSPHDCKQEKEIMDMEKRLSTVNGKIVVLLLFIGLMATTGWTTMSKLDDKVDKNTTRTVVTAEIMAEMRDKISRVLTLVEKIDTRVREIEIKQAENQGR